LRPAVWGLPAGIVGEIVPWRRGEKPTALKTLLACAILASLILTLPPSLKATASAPVQFANWAAWNGYMSHTPAPRAGCFVAKYPSTVWQPSQCVTAPLIRLQPLLPSTVGNGNDEVARSPPSTLIGSSFGSFQSISGLTSETDSIFGADYYTLQDNTNFFTTSTNYTGGKSTWGWEQFVFTSDGFIFIQYWLINYQSSYGSCPITRPPGGSSWMAFQGSCYANSPGTLTPSEAASNLANLILQGYANFGSNDQTILCISGASCYIMAITAQVVNLYQNWRDAEFNVFGYGDGSQANFNSGTSITVSNGLTDQQGKVIVPSCVNIGYTGETNNLNLGSCSSNSNGQIVFTEDSGVPITQTLVTETDAGAGSVSPNCPGGCSETVGSSITITATPSSGWQFSSWSTQAGISCFSNPCAFTMPNNAVTLGATFSQVTQVTQTLTTNVASGSGSVSPSCLGGCPEAVGSSVSVTATPSAGWQFSSWTISGASCSGGSSNNPCQFTMPNDGVTVSATFTQVQVTMFVSYSVLGGGSPTAPVFHYVLNGVANPLTLSPTSKAVSVDSGTTWSVTPNPLGGSSSSQGWYSNQQLTGTSSATTLVFVFYRQTLQTLSYSVSGGSGYSPPTFQANLFGSPTPVTLTATPTRHWFDSGSSWTVTNPLVGPGLTERWFTTQATSGTIGASATHAFPYQHQFYLTMQVNPSGAGSTTPSSSGWYNAGQKVSIKATTKTGFKFLSWTGSGGGSYSGTSSSSTATMNAPIAETANFGVIITIASNPTGSGYVTVDGTPVKTPLTFAWVIGSTHTIAAVSPVDCGTGCQYVFTVWSDGGSQSHTITAPNSPFTYKASLQKQYLLTTTVIASGAGSVLPSTGWYNAGQKVALVATANAGHTFKSWKGTGTGSYTGSNNPSTITMNSTITETANFT
jgi:hypothetical protein